MLHHLINHHRYLFAWAIEDASSFFILSVLILLHCWLEQSHKTPFTWIIDYEPLKENNIQNLCRVIWQPGEWRWGQVDDAGRGGSGGIWSGTTSVAQRSGVSTQGDQRQHPTTDGSTHCSSNRKFIFHQGLANSSYGEDLLVSSVNFNITVYQSVHYCVDVSSKSDLLLIYLIILFMLFMFYYKHVA